MPKSLGNRTKEVKRWWLTRAWWIRYGVYVVVMVGGFYGMENLRGSWAWKRHLSDIHVEFSELQLPEPRELTGEAKPFELTRFVKEIGGDYSPSDEWSYLFLDADGFDPTKFATKDSSGNLVVDFTQCFPELHALGTLSHAQAVYYALEEMAKVEEQLALFVEAAESTPGVLTPQPVLSLADMASQSSLNVARVKEFSQAVAFRGHLKLAKGDSQAALQDALALLRFSRRLAYRGRLIDTTLGLAMLFPTRNLIWQGLDTRAWNTEQLQELSVALKEVEPALWTQWALWAERERFLPLLLSLEGGPVTRYRVNREWGFVNLPYPPYFQSELEPLRVRVSNVICALVPGGWVRGAGAQYCRAQSEHR